MESENSFFTCSGSSPTFPSSSPYSRTRIRSVFYKRRIPSNRLSSLSSIALFDSSSYSSAIRNAIAAAESRFLVGVPGTSF